MYASHECAPNVKSMPTMSFKAIELKISAMILSDSTQEDFLLICIFESTMALLHARANMAMTSV